MMKFMEHPFIQSIKNNEKWTVSDKKKRPLNMWALIDGQRISWAYSPDNECLVTLDKLNKTIPNRTNSAYYIRAIEDGFVVLDIEPTCPEKIKEKLLQTPFLYAERSMSGFGIHLVLPLPENAMDYPVAMMKPALKHGKDYEILLNHYCTFTGNLMDIRPGTESFNEIFYELAAQAIEVPERAVNIHEGIDTKLPKTVHDTLVSVLTTHGNLWNKSLSDYDGDVSRYEFAMMGILYNHLQKYLDSPNFRNFGPIDDSTIAQLMYLSAKEVLPYRHKHDETRHGYPWLLFVAIRFLAKCPQKGDNE